MGNSRVAPLLGVDIRADQALETRKSASNKDELFALGYFVCQGTGWTSNHFAIYDVGVCTCVS